MVGGIGNQQQQQWDQMYFNNASGMDTTKNMLAQPGTDLGSKCLNYVMALVAGGGAEPMSPASMFGAGNTSSMMGGYTGPGSIAGSLGGVQGLGGGMSPMGGALGMGGTPSLGMGQQLTQPLGNFLGM